MSSSAVFRTRAIRLSLALPAFALSLVLSAAGPAHARGAEDPEAALSDLGTRIERAAQQPDLLPWQREALQRYNRSRSVHGPEAGGPRVSGSADGDWSELAPPGGRAGHSVILDPIGRRLLMFGGTDGVYRNDVWVSSLADSSWSVLVTSGTGPSPRVGHSAILDPLRRRMIVFGGRADAARNDAWALSLTDGSWSEIAAGNAPPVRYLHTAVYDSAGDRMLIFGGRDESPRNDVWALTLGGTPTWSQLTPGAAPGPRYGHTAIYDPVRVRMLTFGGFDGTDRNNDVWALTLDGALAWSRITAGGDSGAPIPRYLHTAVYDSTHDQMVVFGGWTGVYVNEAWSLSLAGTPEWIKLNPSGSRPSGRAYPAAVFDRASEFMVILGGFDGGYRNDHRRLLFFSIPTWFNYTTVGLPARLHSHSAIFDAANERMVVFGGSDGFVERNLLWARSFTGAQTWTAIDVGGTPPSGRIDHVAIYDANRGRMLVFGGWDGAYRNDVWSVTLSGAPTWTQLTTTGLPPGRRAGAAGVFDPGRDRMLIFGGLDHDSQYRNDVWALSLTSHQWEEILPEGAEIPPGRAEHTAIYDPINDRVVTYGGWGGGMLDDVWALSLAPTPTWSALAPGGTAPGGRFGHSAVFDPVRGRMVVFGGWNGADRAEVFGLTLSGSAVWSQLAPLGVLPPPRRGQVAIYDSRHDRLTVSGGISVDITRSDTWGLTWGTPDSVGVQCPAPTAWAAGDSVTLSIQLSSPYPFSQSFGYTVSSDRHWPGYPLTGSGVLPGQQILSFPIRVPVPDTAAGGQNTLTISIVPRSAPQRASCSATLFDPARWTAVTAGGSAPTPRSGHTSVYDPLRHRMIVFGGTDGATYSNEVWALSLGDPPAWTPLAPTGGPPSARSAHSAVYDPTGDRMVVFGGFDGTNRSNEAWELALAGTPSWTLLAPLGTPPSARSGTAAIYDPVRDRMVVFGGSLPGFFTQEVWTLSLDGTSTWTQLTPGGSFPAGREGGAAVYDPTGDRMLIFGGNQGFPTNEVLQLTLVSPTWSTMTTPGSAAPEPRSESAAIFDAERERMVVVGGLEGGVTPRDDSWILAPGIRFWARQQPTGTLPAARSAHTAILDPVLERVVIFGGVGAGGTRFNDVHALSWNPPSGSVTVESPGTVAWPAGTGRSVTLTYRVRSSFHFDQPADYRITDARGWPAFPIEGTIQLAREGTASIEVSVPIPDTAAVGANSLELVLVPRSVPQAVSVSHLLGAEPRVTPSEFRFALMGARPNPSPRGDLSIAFSLASRDPAQLEMFDLGGRRVQSRRVETLGPGNHVVSLRGSGLRPGVYMIRLSQGTRRLTSRVVVLN
jgi:hypothetical protein